MATIYHLKVGSKPFAPTDDDLKEAIVEFEKPIPVFSVPVTVAEIHASGLLPEKMLLHAGAPLKEGAADKLRALFESALDRARSGKYAVVATAYQVSVSFVSEPRDDEYAPPLEL